MSALPAHEPARQGVDRPVAGRRPTTVRPYARPHTLLGDPAPLACTLGKAVMESISGGTDLTPLARWIAPELRETLLRQQSLARRRGLRPRPTQILRARVCRTSATSAEVSLVVDDGEHSRAIAMRLEDMHGRWLATVIDVL